MQRTSKKDCGREDVFPSQGRPLGSLSRPADDTNLDAAGLEPPHAARSVLTRGERGLSIRLDGPQDLWPLWARGTLFVCLTTACFKILSFSECPLSTQRWKAGRRSIQRFKRHLSQIFHNCRLQPGSAILQVHSPAAATQLSCSSSQTTILRPTPAWVQADGLIMGARRVVWKIDRGRCTPFEGVQKPISAIWRSGRCEWAHWKPTGMSATKRPSTEGSKGQDTATGAQRDLR